MKLSIVIASRARARLELVAHLRLEEALLRPRRVLVKLVQDLVARVAIARLEPRLFMGGAKSKLRKRQVAEAIVR